MFGNCDVGRLSIEMAPRMTVTIAMTMATIGRRMKNLDMISFQPTEWWKWGRHRSRLLRSDGSAFPQLLQIVGDDAHAGLDTAVNDPVVLAILRSELHVDDVNLVVRVNSVDLLHALQLLNSDLRNQQGVSANLGFGRDAAELARPKNIARIGERGSDADSAGLLVHLTIDKLDLAFMRIRFAVGERQRERHGSGGVQQVASRFACPRRQRQIFGVADREVDLDGIELRNRGEDRLRADEVSDLRGGLSGHAVDQGTHLRESEIQFGSFESGFRGGDSGLRGIDGGLGGTNGRLLLRLGLLVVIELALGDGPGLRKRCIALHIDLRQLKLSLRLSDLSLCLRHLSLRLGHLPLRLIYDRLKGPRVNLKQNLPFGHDRAFAVLLANQIAADLRLNLRIDVAIESADPFARQRHVGLSHLHDGNRHGTHRGGGRSIVLPPQLAQCDRYTVKATPVRPNCRAFRLVNFDS